MKCFVALSYQNRVNLRPVVDEIKRVLLEAGFEAVVFVDKQPTSIEPRLLMEEALTDLRGCHLLVAEMTTKEVGVGIEMGVAHARGIPIIGIRRLASLPSTTMEGILDYELIQYSAPEDLLGPLKLTLERVTNDEKKRKLELSPFAQLLMDAARRDAEALLQRMSLQPDGEMNEALTLSAMYEIITGFEFTQRDKGVSHHENVFLEARDMLLEVYNVHERIFDTIATIVQTDQQKQLFDEHKMALFKYIWAGGLTNDERKDLFSPLRDLPGPVSLSERLG